VTLWQSYGLKAQKRNLVSSSPRGEKTIMISIKPSILFITWDGPQTNYLENLFFPIFSGLHEWQFHVLQFSWAAEEKQDQLKELACQMGITYTPIPVIRKPHPILGTIITLAKGIRFLRSYIAEQDIEVLMPRSTFPAIIAQALKKKQPGLKIIFDADGMPLEERVDFSGLDPKGLQYRLLKSQERKMLLLADRVLVRSHHASRHHLQHIGESYSSKFFRVSNGRDERFFTINSDARAAFRKQLGLSEHQLLLVYTGSLGPQYGWEIMAGIFQELLKRQPDSRLLILSGNPEYLQNRIAPAIADSLTIISGRYEDVPGWLNAADFALAIRKPMPSMRGVAPIKLGEYLLMGLPTIASKGIGDSEELLEGLPFVCLFDHDHEGEEESAAAWITDHHDVGRDSIRQFAQQHFTLNKSIGDYRQALAEGRNTNEV